MGETNVFLVTLSCKLLFSGGCGPGLITTGIVANGDDGSSPPAEVLQLILENDVGLITNRSSATFTFHLANANRSSVVFTATLDGFDLGEEGHRILERASHLRAYGKTNAKSLDGGLEASHGSKED